MFHLSQEILVSLDLQVRKDFPWVFNSILCFLRTIMYNVIFLTVTFDLRCSGPDGTCRPRGSERTERKPRYTGCFSSKYMMQVHWLAHLQWLCVISDQVITGWMGRQVWGVVRAQLAPEVSQDLQALEQKVKEVWLKFPAVTDLH